VAEGGDGQVGEEAGGLAEVAVGPGDSQSSSTAVRPSWWNRSSAPMASTLQSCGLRSVTMQGIGCDDLAAHEGSLGCLWQPPVGGSDRRHGVEHGVAMASTMGKNIYLSLMPQRKRIRSHGMWVVSASTVVTRVDDCSGARWQSLVGTTLGVGRGHHSGELEQALGNLRGGPGLFQCGADCSCRSGQ
jgi:hypothetical protein